MKEKPKIIFFGSDQYSQIVLDSLRKDASLKISAVFEPGSIVRIIELKKTHPIVGVVASFGKILSDKILNLFPKGILNIHPSLLPKYRGPSPTQAAILNGDKQTGVTIIKMDNKIDHGPIVAQFAEEIIPSDTSESLYCRLFSAGAEVLKTILPAYLENRIELRPQDHSQATYTKKLTRDDGKVNWSKPDDYLERFIRAMFPYPGAWCEIKLKVKNEKLKIKRLKILKAHLENGKLILDKVQLEGKKPVTWKQFLEGYPKAKILS